MHLRVVDLFSHNDFLIVSLVKLYKNTLKHREVFPITNHNPLVHKLNSRIVKSQVNRSL